MVDDEGDHIRDMTAEPSARPYMLPPPQQSGESGFDFDRGPDILGTSHPLNSRTLMVEAMNEDQEDPI